MSPSNFVSARCLGRRGQMLTLERSTATTYLVAALWILVVAAAWSVTVPTVLTQFNFLAVAGLLTALGWVGRTTYQNGQSADTVAGLIHDTESADSRKSTSRGHD